MSHFPEPDLGPEFAPFAVFRQRFGFVPRLFRAQSILPRLIEAEAEIAGTVLLTERGLTRIQKELLLLAIAAHYRNVYCATAHAKFLRELGVAGQTVEAAARDHRHAALAPEDVALLDFGLKLATRPTRIRRGDFDVLRKAGFDDEQILEAVLTAGLTRFLCTLSTGVGAEPDDDAFAAFPEPGRRPEAELAELSDDAEGNFLACTALSEKSFPPFAFFKERFGFVPNIFRAQTLREDVLAAEAKVVGSVLLTEDVLSRFQKEAILLVVSAANLNTYCVAVHCEMLRALGVPEESSEQIAVDHRLAGLSDADVALLDAALLLAREPDRFGRDMIDALRLHGFSDEQILEAIVMAALTQFLNTLQMGLGTVPDFPARTTFPTEPEKKVNPAGGLEHQTDAEASDPDLDAVRRVRAGDVQAFEVLVRRHGGRVLRSLRNITADAAEAEDALQDAFLKAFEKLPDFRSDSLFSTWLTRIAINEALQRLRARRPLESLDAEDESSFRPRLILPWLETPESLYSEAERRELVGRAVAGLPEKYRIAVVLRDMEQLSTDEAAAALGLPVPTMKTRLLRGRLMLREALAPHFVVRDRSTRA